MSIFKSTFTKSVKDQIGIRQSTLKNRTTQGLQYINNRNAWIRMSSAVNVNGSKDLASKYILQGGTLNDGKTLKSGLGDFTNAYSNTSVDGSPYSRGIRPMPGITNMDIKSLSAYGSLRSTTINFQCWDIKQLEDLEVLYMRPGYTVLIEWGWSPFIDNNGSYQPNFTDYYDIINKGLTERSIIFKELFDKSVKYGGNYDAMYGYVKNYSWSARPDGGYDCSTTVISTGEIIESIKTNFLPPQSFISNNDGLLNNEFTSQGNTFNQWNKNGYQHNILAGVWAEAYYKLKDPNTGKLDALPVSSSFRDNAVIIPMSFEVGRNEQSLDKGSGFQVYITLGAAIDIINKHVLPKQLIQLSLDSNEYDGDEKSNLLCVAHPLQVSTDPSICLIKNPLWYGKDNIADALINAIDSTDIATNAATAESIFNIIYEKGTQGTYSPYGDGQAGTSAGFKSSNEITKGLLEINNSLVYELVLSKIKNNSIEHYSNLAELIANTFDNRTRKDYKNITLIKEHLGTLKILVDFKDFIALSFKGRSFNIDNLLEDGSVFYENLIVSNTNLPADASIHSSISLAQNPQLEKQALGNLQFLKYLGKDYFFNGDPYVEAGIIKNIYVNIDFLYRQALNSNLESQDKQGKNEISIYTYLKSIISQIQTVIGSVSNFEVHVDPIDNLGRIIDINYIESKTTNDKNIIPSRATIYDNLFQLEVHNLNSTVRNYSLASSIFPEQASIIAIGAQSKGGQLGIQSNTMIDFNRGLTDRILGQLLVGNISVSATKNPSISALYNLILLFDQFGQGVSSESNTDFNALTSKAQNSLKDLIAYFQSITSSPGSNRTLIPTKFSFEMDGIGGLVIGHMFKINPDMLPRGYKGVLNLGSQLGQVITGIGHTLSNGDWITKVETLNIILTEREGVAFQELNLNDIKSIIAAPTISTTNISNSGKTHTPSLSDYANKWKHMNITQDTRSFSAAKQIADLVNMGKYNNISSKTNIPTYVIGILHYREASLNFNKRLQDGNNLDPGMTFDQDAISILLKIFGTHANWSTISNVLKHIESYNGFGYTGDNIKNNSPYVWSGTDLYTSGKFIGDKIYNSSYKDTQIGAAAIMGEFQAHPELKITIPKAI